MALVACGVNYKTASLAFREQLTVAPEKLSESLNDLVRQQGVKEAAILSTCNRTELYCAADDNVVLLDWFSRHHQVAPKELQPHYYQYREHAAFKHAVRVASGLDSMLLGEPQILGQMKSAIAQAEQLGTLGACLKRTFSAIFSASKQVRTQTEIGANSLSVATLSIHLAKRIFAQLSSCTVLCIGAGDTIDLVAKHLTAQPVKQLIIANRTVSKAQQLAEKYAGCAVSLSDISQQLPQADIVISATSNPLPILGKGMIERALKLRKHRPILMVDLGVPRNIESEVAQLNDVYLYSLDDLHNVIKENKDKRQQAAAYAENIIDLYTTDFMRNQRVDAAANLIRDYRDKVMSMRDTELTKAIQRLVQGENPEQVLQALAFSLTNKFLHQPTVQMRSAAADGQLELLAAAQQLFQLNPTHEDVEHKSNATKCAADFRLVNMQQRPEFSGNSCNNNENSNSTVIEPKE